MTTITPSQLKVLAKLNTLYPGIVEQALSITPPPAPGFGAATSSSGSSWYDQLLGSIDQLVPSYLEYRAATQNPYGYPMSYGTSAQQELALQQQLSASGIGVSGVGGLSMTDLLIGGAIIIGGVILISKSRKRGR